jgi:hypothetical protein
MKSKILFAIVFAALTAVSFGQQGLNWDKWSWLIGAWKGEGSGLPGQGGGEFTFQFDLDQQILVRKSHSEYPAAPGKPNIVHEDLLIVYPDSTGKPMKAVYFDNEGHVIHYSVAIADSTIALTSEKTANVPIFRLIYERLDDRSVKVKFEMSQDGEKYSTYLEGTSVRIKEN